MYWEISPLRAPQRLLIRDDIVEVGQPWRGFVGCNRGWKDTLIFLSVHHQ
jgi:hypothetical protein